MVQETPTPHFPSPVPGLETTGIGYRMATYTQTGTCAGGTAHHHHGERIPPPPPPPPTCPAH